LSRANAELFRLLAAAALAAVLAPAFGIAAPPARGSQAFNAPYRKTLEDYERHADRNGAGREAFQRGLKALDGGAFNDASNEFAASDAAAPAYEAAFDEALSEQLAHRYSRAEALYEKARRLDRRDPELETNLAIVLAAEGKGDASLKSIETALTLTNDPDVRGRTLYERSLIEFDFGRLLEALTSLGQADAAFEAAGDAPGRAVAAARRGEMLLAMHGDGETLLLNAVAQLQSAGAFVDESDARLKLAWHYLDADNTQAAAAQFERAVAAAEASENSQQLGKTLNDRGSYQFGQGQRTAAIKDFEGAIAAFQKVHDRFGEGEANNNLGGLYLKSDDIDRGFQYCANAVRAYRRAGSARALEKAIAFADVFRQLGQEPRQKYFLDIGHWLLGKSPPAAAKANLLIGSARYDLNHDLHAAAVEANEARDIFATRQDVGGVTIAELVLERINDARTAALTHSLLATALFSALVWLALAHWGELWSAARAVARIIFAPFRMAAVGCRRLDNWWTGRPLPDADEETKRFDRFRVRLLRVLFAAGILTVIAFDAVTVTGPNLAYISMLRQAATAEGEILPPDMIEAFQGLLDRNVAYVLLAVLVQVAILVVAYISALFISGSLESTLFGSIQRPLRRAAPPIDPNAQACATAALETLQRRFALALIATTLGALAIVEFTSLPLKLVGRLLLGALFAIEAVLYVLLRRTLRTLPQQQRNGAFAFVSRIGSHAVSTLLLGIVAYLYAFTPGFYTLANLAQRRLVLPLFADVEQRFFSVLTEAVPKYGTFALTGDVAVAFSHLRRAYDPGAGAAHLWTDLLPQLLPYALGVWVILLTTRLVVPFVASLGPLSAAWKILRIAILAVAFHQFSELFFVHVFQLDEAVFWNQLSVWGISGVLTIIVEHTVMAAFEAHQGKQQPHGPVPHAGAPEEAGKPPESPLTSPTGSGAETH
jgi:tetratricopeptide (TPR) repeat protein